MVGEAHTVFSGTKPEPFKVRVVSVVRNFLPKQDIILVRAEDPRVEFSGIAAGMSGSPVYIDGKLLGAIAYAWSFAKEPLAGVTPIEAMLAERSRPRRATRTLVESGELVYAPGAGGGEISLAEPAVEAAPGRRQVDARMPQLRRVSVPAVDLRDLGGRPGRAERGAQAVRPGAHAGRRRRQAPQDGRPAVDRWCPAARWACSSSAAT